MQLYLLRKTELRMTILPTKISGQQLINYTDDNGKTVPLVRINAKDEKWYIRENKQVQINGDVKKAGEYNEYELIENALYFLRINNSENMILMVEPEVIAKKYYQTYKVPDSGIIDIGRAEYNQIQFRYQYISEKRHLRICYKNGLPFSVEIDKEGVQPGAKNPSYLNGKRINGENSVKIGDVIFLFGLKIVLGKDFIAINDQDDRAAVHLESKETNLFFKTEVDKEVSEKWKTFSSAPRARKEFIHKEFNIEQPPEVIKGNDTPWIVMLGPSLTMAMGSLFSSVITINNILSGSGNISSAMPSLVTAIVMVMGSAVWPIIGRRVQNRSQERKTLIASKDYEIYLEQIQKEIEDAIKLQGEILKENNPLLEECIQAIKNVKETLWERSQRHKDFLDVMIGIGDVPLDADFSYPERGYHSEISESAKDMYQLMAEKHMVKNVPITLPLKDAGIVGIIGDREKIIKFCKALLIELTAMHNYEDLKIIFIYDEKEKNDWEFVKWIPHLWNDEQTVRYIANDADKIKKLSEQIHNIQLVQKNENGKYQSGPYYLIFAADKVLAERAQAIKDFYYSPDNKNMTMIALYNERQYLPKECSYVIDLIHETERKKFPEKYNGIEATVADFNDITGNYIICHESIKYDDNPEKIFVQMSNIHLDTASVAKQLPTQYTFMDMFEIGKPEHLDLIRRWKEHSAVDTLAAPIGVDSDGYFINLDIHEKAHGPHGVIAGMTGSGKSEFIISYIASMAINYSPEEVAFVLIDFKGGGMADIFKDLPHTAGLITNLDGNELKRSFLAIEHELEKRQKLFKEISEQKKISNIDIYKYQRLRQEDGNLQPLPHLILISDEFAELKQQHRDFMEQLIRIARIGRSLGVHLILATQKPDGVVDDQIKSNIRFKVCMKVQDKSDSQGMIGRPDATLITNPGRFYFQVGNDEIFEYGQSSWSGALYEPKEHVQKNICDYIDIVDEQGTVICREHVPKGVRTEGIPEKQIDAIVQFIRNISEQNNLQTERLWLEPLPAPKAEKKKDTIYETKIQPFVLNPEIGMYDDLINQKHLPLTVPFTTMGNALLYGVSGSGKLEFLNKMLVELMKHHSAEEVNFYLCDFDSGALSAFEGAEYTKIYAGAGECEGAQAIFNRILYELTQRREIMKKYGGEYHNYIQTSGRKLPNILLVVHNYQNLSESYIEARQNLMNIVREGTKYGIYTVITGTSANSIPYSMQPLFRNIYTLRQNSEDQYREIVGKTGGIVPEEFKGRGLVRANGIVCEFQTAIVFEDSDNTYEAIQQFCEIKKYSGNAADSLENEQIKTAEERESVGANKYIEYKLNAIPVAKAKEDRQIIKYNLSEKLVTLVIYDEEHMKQLESLDWAVRLSVKDNAQLFELKPEDGRLPEQINQLWQIIVQRGMDGAAAKEKGEPIPVFPTIVVSIHEPSRITDVVDEEERQKLVAMIINKSKGYQIRCVLWEKQEHIFDMMQGKCLSLLEDIRDGILLSTNKSAYAPFSEELNLGEQEIPRSPYGLIIQNYLIQLGEILEVPKELKVNEQSAD